MSKLWPVEFKAAILFGFLLPSTAVAQPYFGWSNQFATRVSGRLWPAEVWCATKYDDGTGPRLYIGGGLSSVGSSIGDGILRWNGGAWEMLTRHHNLLSPIRAMTVLAADGASGMRPSLIIGGDERIYRFDLGFHGIARWDGSSFHTLGDGIRGTVHALTVFDDGSGPSIIAGGNFTIAGGITANNIARWDGKNWSPLGDGITRTGALATVRALAVIQGVSGPLLVAGGEFSMAGGLPVNNIAAWDGATWASLSTGITSTVAEPSVRVLAAYDDGSGTVLYAGGRFNFAGAAPAANIASWTGTKWSPLGAGTNAIVKSLGLFEDGGKSKLCIGGEFEMAGGLPAARIANWDGQSWGVFGFGIPPGSQAPGSVNAISTIEEGKSSRLFVGGFFIDLTNTNRAGALIWNGQDWITLGQVGVPLNNSVSSLIEWDDDGPGSNPPFVLAGGSFSRSGSTVLNRLAKFSNGQWADFEGGVTGHVYAGPSVFCMTRFDEDGPGIEPECLYIGGDFSSVGGVPARGVAKWNPVTRQWSGFGTGFAITDQVYSIAFYDDGSGPALYAGGYGFAYINRKGQSIAKWNKAGEKWEALGDGIHGVNTWVRDLCIYRSGPSNRPVLVATGNFQHAGRVEAISIAQWDGTSWSPLGNGIGTTSPFGYVLHTAEENGIPMLYLGGSFDSVGGVPAQFLARWDGIEWHGYPGVLSYSGISKIDGITTFDDGTGPALYVAGRFRAHLDDDSTTDCIAKWNGTSWRRLGSGLGDSVPGSTLNVRTALLPSGQNCNSQLLVGGRFATASGTQSPFISAWSRRPASVGVSPLHRRVAEGSDLTIHADVKPCGAAEFQWRRYAIPLQDSKRISGATSPEIRIESISEADAGEYDLVVTDQIGRSTGYAISVFIEPTPVTLDSTVEPLSAEPAQRNSPERASSCAKRTNTLLQE